jgi:hypothetical protein
MTPMIRQMPETAVIAHGSHDSFDGGACALEWVSYLTAQPHSDAPSGVSPTLRAFVLSWNDALPNDAERDRLLRGVIPKLIDSAGSEAVELRRSYLAFDWLARVQVPAWMDLTPSLVSHAVTLRSLGELRDKTGVQAASGPLAAAGAKLQPTVTMLEQSALDLIDRMLAITEASC